MDQKFLTTSWRKTAKQNARMLNPGYYDLRKDTPDRSTAAAFNGI